MTTTQFRKILESELKDFIENSNWVLTYPEGRFETNKFESLFETYIGKKYIKIEIHRMLSKLGYSCFLENEKHYYKGLIPIDKL